MDEHNEGVEQPIEEQAGQPEPQEEAHVETPSTEEPEEASEGTETEMPESPKEREAFIQMRKENKALKERLRLAEVQREFAEPMTLDSPAEALLRRQQLTERATVQAMQEIEGFRIERENQELFHSFPSLNPQSKDFDPALDARVAEKYYFEKHVKGNDVTPLDVANAIKAETEKIFGKAKEEATKETVEKINRRELATGEVTSNTAQRSKATGQEYMEQLRRRVREGDEAAKIEYDKIIFGE